MEKQKNLIVQVRVYQGAVNFDENGNVKSRNQLMKLRYGIREWDLFLQNINKLGWTRVDVVKCLDGNEKLEENGMFNHPIVETPDYLAEEIKVAMKGSEVPLTKDQQEIKELKETVAQLVGGKKAVKTETKKEAPKTDPVVDDKELDAARAKYLEVIGKKAHHKFSIEKINGIIEEKLNENGGE